MQKNDIIVSSASGYSFNQLECWAKSIRQSGFEGEAYLVLYDDDPAIASSMNELGINIFSPKANHLGNYAPDVVVDRFYQKWVLINDIGRRNINRVISTDVHDVVFQSNPTAWLDENLGSYKLFVTSEGIAYKDEPWGRENFKKCFGTEIWNSGIPDRSIFNCGVWGGVSEYVADMFLMIYLIGFGHPMHLIGQRPSARWTDQATLNLISHLSLFRSDVKFIKSEDGFAAQLGTILAPGTGFSEFLNEPRPVVRNGEVFTASGQKYVVVHQYNRVPELREQLMNRYK